MRIIKQFYFVENRWYIREQKKLSANHNLYTADVKKISLSPFNDKKFILWNGEEYTTYSFGHYKTKDVSMEQ